MNGKIAFIVLVVVLVLGGGFFLLGRQATPPMPVAEQPFVAETPAADAAEGGTELPQDQHEGHAHADENYDHASALAEASAEEKAEANTEAPAEGQDSVTEESTGNAPVAPAQESLLKAPPVIDIDVRAALMDRFIGNENAPVTVIEYASMTCPHCAYFHNDLLPEVKRDVIENGKARLVFRDFPIDTFALRAAMMARCAPAEKYFDLVEVIFKNQERWTRSEDPLRALMQLGNLAGMNDDYIKACISNPELEAALLRRVKDAQAEFNVRSTPSFIFNTERNTNVHSLSGIGAAKELTDAVNKLLSMR